MRVQCAHEKLVSEDGKTTIHHAATGLKLVRQVSLVTPDSTSCPRVEGKGAVVLPGSIQNTIHNQGGGLKLAEIGNLEGPLHRQMRGFSSIDLFHRAVAPAVVSPRIREPALRLLVCLEQALVSHLGGHTCSAGHEHGERERDCFYARVHSGLRPSR